MSSCTKLRDDLLSPLYYFCHAAYHVHVLLAMHDLLKDVPPFSDLLISLGFLYHFIVWFVFLESAWFDVMITYYF